MGQCAMQGQATGKQNIYVQKYVVVLKEAEKKADAKEKKGRSNCESKAAQGQAGESGADGGGGACCCCRCYCCCCCCCCCWSLAKNEGRVTEESELGLGWGGEGVRGECVCVCVCKRDITKRENREAKARSLSLSYDDITRIPRTGGLSRHCFLNARYPSASIPPVPCAATLSCPSTVYSSTGCWLRVLDSERATQQKRSIRALPSPPWPGASGCLHFTAACTPALLPSSSESCSPHPCLAIEQSRSCVQYL